MSVPSRFRRPRLTERIARACAARPRRTLAAWGVAIAAALALVGTTLHGLSSSYHAVGQPESAKAAKVIAQAFPPSVGPAGDAGDVISRPLHALQRPVAGVPVIRGSSLG